MNYGPSPLTTLTFAERIARQQGRANLAFTVVTTISLGLLALKVWDEMTKAQDCCNRG